MLDDELRMLVSVEPSSEWRARVQRHVAADHSRSRVIVSSRSLLAAAAVVLAIGAGVWMRVPAQPSLTPVPDLDARALPVTAFIPAARDAVASDALPVSSGLRTPRTALRVDSATIQIDEAEARALQELFASSLRLAAPDVQAPATEPLVVPEISIQPLAEPSEGDHQ